MSKGGRAPCWACGMPTRREPNERSFGERICANCWPVFRKGSDAAAKTGKIDMAASRAASEKIREIIPWRN